MRMGAVLPALAALILVFGWDNRVGYSSEITGQSTRSAQEVRMNIVVANGAFKDGEMIPAKYTCDGSELSPAIEWSGVPLQAKSIALISDDPDAPRGTWVHWVIFNIPPRSTGLPEGVPHKEVLENGAAQGINDSNEVGYGSPCPPSGVHRYYFKLYALDTLLALKPRTTKAELEKAMAGHIIAQAQAMGRYKRY